MPDAEFEIPNDPGVTPEDIEPGADLNGADLSDAFLTEADLSGAHLIEADLSGASLSEANLLDATLSKANLSEATLVNADLSEATLHRAEISDATLSKANFSNANLTRASLAGSLLSTADLSEAILVAADLSEAILSGANLSNANLHGADLRNADLRTADLSEANLIRTTLEEVVLWNTSLSDAQLSRQTAFDPPQKGLEKIANNPESDHLSDPADRWDAIARANTELRNLFSDNGLLSQARQARARERRARRNEARHDETRRGTLAWLGSLLSRWTTGYGVKLRPVVGVMLALFLGSAVVYATTGMAVGASLYYSVVTFTTSPPAPPDPGVMRLVAGIETFLGTTMIVFLGYVLGAREQV